MQSDPRSEAARWLAQAGEDLVVAEKLRELGHHFASCFHAQQSAEKALKAALIGLGLAIARTHSV
ncbi:MAG: HEPN domain-containing protein [Planctomycetes bacterium]|nr:HEPN domain-containing protein [Planctomycetota bacterium]